MNVVEYMTPQCALHMQPLFNEEHDGSEYELQEMKISNYIPFKYDNILIKYRTIGTSFDTINGHT